MTTATLPKTTGRKLSELGRAGAKCHPQARLNYVARNSLTGEISTCFLGAVYVALFGKLPDTEPGYIFDVLAEHVDLTKIPYPPQIKRSEGLPKTVSPLALAIQLNDLYGWSYEQIADYFESQGV